MSCCYCCSITVLCEENRLFVVPQEQYASNVECCVSSAGILSDGSMLKNVVAQIENLAVRMMMEGWKPK